MCSPNIMNAQEYIKQVRPQAKALRDALKAKIAVESPEKRAQLLCGCMLADEQTDPAKWPPQMITGLCQYTYVLMHELIEELAAEENAKSN